MPPPHVLSSDGGYALDMVSSPRITMARKELGLVCRCGLGNVEGKYHSFHLFFFLSFLLFDDRNLIVYFLAILVGGKSGAMEVGSAGMQPSLFGCWVL